MKDHWLRKQTLKLSEGVVKRFRTIEARLDNSGKRWADLEQRLHDAEQLLWAEIDVRRRGEAIGMPLAPESPVGLKVAVAKAITDERSLMFRYTKDGESDWECRQLSPYELIKGQNGVVVRGWDHQRDAIRSFRLDRMEGVTGGTFNYRKPLSS